MQKESLSHIVSGIKARKFLFLPLVAMIVFLLLRTLLLQKPNTELTYTVKQEDLVDTVQVSGTYTTASQTQVTSPTNGVITELFVSNGEEVKKGEPLFHIDSTATSDQQKTAYANYTSALNSLQTAQNTKQSLDATMWTKQQAYLTAQNNQNYKNNHTQNPSTKTDYTDLEKQQIDSSVVQSQKDFEAAQQAYKTADVSVGAAQAKVAETYQLYQETQSATVTAPADGTVVNLLANIGDQVTAPVPTTPSTQTTLSAQSVQPVLVIANLGDPYITANISEDYAARITSGQKATMIFDGLKNKTFTGIVGSVATVGINNQGVVTYPTRIQASDLSSQIKPNMTALITIETLRKNGVLDVPNSAIIMKDESTFVELPNSHKLIPVTVGMKGIAKTEIVSGLTAGTVIVSNP